MKWFVSVSGRFDELTVPRGGRTVLAMKKESLMVIFVHVL
jgi:hypothetical protein